MKIKSPHIDDAAGGPVVLGQAESAPSKVKSSR